MSPDQRGKRTPQESLLFAKSKRNFGLFTGIRQVDLGLTNEEMAKQLGVPVEMYTDFKRGQGGDDYIIVFAKVCKLMKIDLFEDEK